MPLSRAKKTSIVDTLAAALKDAPATVIASFRSLTMTDSSQLRRTLRATGGTLQVVPKRLFSRVLQRLNWPGSLSDTRDSVVVAWSADLAAPAKALFGYVKVRHDAQFLGGVVDGSPVSGEDVERLATLPSREILQAQVVSVLAAPLRGMVGIFASVLRGVPAVLSARVRSSSS